MREPYIEDFIKEAIEKIEKKEKEVSCIENKMAINKLEEALLWLELRQKDREQRGVAGTKQD